MSHIETETEPPTQSASEDPSDHTTLVEIINGYRESGFDSDFSALEGATIRCDSCGTETAASEFVIQSLRRMEGASDPDDMLAVIATCCPICNADGTLILGYGPMAAGDDVDVATAMEDGRLDGPLAPHSSPADDHPTVDPPTDDGVMDHADLTNGEGPSDSTFATLKRHR